MNAPLNMNPAIFQTIVICLAAVAIAFFAFRAFQKVGTRAVEAPKEIVEAGGEAARKNIEAIGGEIRNLLGATPEITINRTIIQEAPATICELYFFKQAIQTREQLISKKLGSSKTLVVSQKFIIKAGFDLNRIRLDFDADQQTFHATIAGGLVIGVEHDGPFEVEKSESGWWNRITDEERDQLINSLPAKARNEVETSALRQLAAGGLNDLLTRICERRNMKLKMTCSDEGQSLVRESKNLLEPTLAIDQLALFDRNNTVP
jgi:hypothetical protein